MTSLLSFLYFRKPRIRYFKVVSQNFIVQKGKDPNLITKECCALLKKSIESCCRLLGLRSIKKQSKVHLSLVATS